MDGKYKLRNIYKLPEEQSLLKAKPKIERHDCSHCNKSMNNESMLSQHCKLIHENPEPTINIVKLNEDPKPPTNTDDDTKKPKFPCDKCDRVFRNVSSIVYHKEAEHNSGRKFVCGKCGKSFKHKQLLQRHYIMHTDDRPYACEFCDASFKTKPNLLNHLPKHSGIKKHECYLCKQTFAHKTSLKLHYRWHSGTKPFVCKVNIVYST